MHRDPQRTKDRILAAALKEFSAKGFTGARVDAIARRARVNKRMLYHYFGNKEGLFREILHRKVAEKHHLFRTSPGDPAEKLAHYYEMACHDVDWVRLVEWEALTAGSKRVIAEDDRRQAFEESVGAIRRAQADGHLSDELDPEQLLLSFMALTSYPLAFPQHARLVTGLSPSDPEFRKKRSEFLHSLAEHLRPRSRRSPQQ
jgi:TetR/AcrR family transcriptional regulator